GSAEESGYLGITLRNKRLFLAAFAAVLGNFSAGFSLVYTSPVIPALEKSTNPRLKLTQVESSWFGSMFMLGAAAGGLSSMVLNDSLGRKLSIMVSAVPSALGYLLMGSAQNIWMLLLGRLLTGYAGGVTSASIPVYISEISHPGVRGALGACPQIMAVLGSLCLYALALKLDWRWLAVAGEVPVLVMIVLLYFMPNSPRFLISEGKDEEARQALCWLRGKETDYPRELQQIKESVRNGRVSCAEIRDPFMYKPIRIAVLMRFLQQLSGVTPILVYLQPIFKSTAVILVRAVRLVSVLIAAVSMDKAGRKILLFVSGKSWIKQVFLQGFQSSQQVLIISAMHCSRACFSWSSGEEREGGTNAAMGLSLGLSHVEMGKNCYAMGWGPITWLLMSEILPLKARGVASGLCVVVSWLTAFGLEAFGLEVPFLFFAFISVMNLIFTGCCVPETKGRSLEQIESYFRTGRRSFMN
uniref:Solute carrier family 2 member 6 n=1 Tax=Crocodylus porosus TaxID=8502 RepID=A0A7M4EIY3_CROPO